jgi:23S rRNA pseudouridine1911/1915/1917 synthase
MRKPEIIYQDEAFLIVSKPADFLTIPDRFDPGIPSVLGFLKKDIGEPIFIVHRLDRETSGAMCFARTAEAHRDLSIQFEKREVDKRYLAIVEGRFRETEGTVDAPLEPNPQQGGTMRVGRDGKPSRTDWKVLEQFNDHALVECKIHTGRMHQVRVHMAHIGHPLSVDPLYGRRSAFMLSSIKKRYKISKMQDEELPIMHRTTLHAHRLSLRHPVTGEQMNFEVEPPKDFRALLNQLRKH